MRFRVREASKEASDGVSRASYSTRLATECIYVGAGAGLGVGPTTLTLTRSRPLILTLTRALQEYQEESSTNLKQQLFVLRARATKREQQIATLRKQADMADPSPSPSPHPIPNLN